MSVSKGKLIAGGIFTYAVAVIVGYQITSDKKPVDEASKNSTAPNVNPRNFNLNDSQRIASFNKHAISYDNGKDIWLVNFIN